MTFRDIIPVTPSLLDSESDHSRPTFSDASSTDTATNSDLALSASDDPDWEPSDEESSSICEDEWSEEESIAIYASLKGVERHAEDKDEDFAERFRDETEFVPVEDFESAVCFDAQLLEDAFALKKIMEPGFFSRYGFFSRGH